MDKTSQNVVVVMWVVFALAIIIGAPLVSIWSVNTIFGLSIAYTFSNWFASFWISAVTISARSIKIGK